MRLKKVFQGFFCFCLYAGMVTAQETTSFWILWPYLMSEFKTKIADTFLSVNCENPKLFHNFYQFGSSPKVSEISLKGLVRLNKELRCRMICIIGFISFGKIRFKFLNDALNRNFWNKFFWDLIMGNGMYLFWRKTTLRYVEIIYWAQIRFKEIST